MATGGGVKEVGIRLKVGATGLDNVERLGKALRDAGVDTQALDRQAEELGQELQKTGGSSEALAGAQEKLAPAARDAAKAADDLAQAAKQGGTELGHMASGSEGARQKLGDMKLELAAAGAAAYTIGRALGGAAKDASEFETAMAEVGTLVEDTSGLTAQAEAVRTLAREYGGDAAQQAKALYQIISAGAKEGAEATGILDQANKLAVGGVTDITTAADGLTSILNAYGGEAGTAAQVSDALFVAMKAGKTTVGELSGSIGQVAPISAQAGVGLDELLAATAALTKGGTSTSESMTQLRGLISAIIKPSGEAQKAAADLGLSFDAQSLKAKGLAGFLEEVRAKTGGNTEVMAQLFGSVEALGGVLALTGSQAGSFQDVLQAMQTRAGATDEAFGKMAETSGFAGKQFSAALNDARISMGQALTALTPLLEAVTDGLNLFNELPQPVKTATAAVVGLGLAVGPMALAVGSLSRAVGLAASAIGLKSAAAAASVLPLRSATVATAGLGAASAAATVPVTAAAGAVGLLSRAVGVLGSAARLVTGPVGLLVGTVAALVPEFLRAKKAAEDGDEAVRKMLSGPQNPALPAKAKEAADATGRAGDAAKQAEQQHQALAVAARQAASALGVDMAAASNVVTLEFGKQLDNLGKLEAGLKGLARTGVDTGKVVSEALAKMVDGAKNQAEFDALRARIEALGKAGTISKTQVVDLLESIRKKADEAVAGVNSLAEAYKLFGISSKSDLDKVAASSRQAWALIRADATATLEVKQRAFQKYAADAIAANGGVADSTIKAEASALGLAVQVDKTGKAIVRAMDEGGKAVDATKKKFNDFGQEVNALGEVINSVAGGIVSSMTKAGDVFTTAGRAARNAQVSANGIDSIGDHIRATPSGGITRTATVTTPYPAGAEPGDYEWVDQGYNRGGAWVLTQAASERMASDMWGAGRGPNAGVPRFDPVTGKPLAASPAQQQPASAQGWATQGGYEIRFVIGGQAHSVAARNQADAEQLVRQLQEAFRQAGGG